MGKDPAGAEAGRMEAEVGVGVGSLGGELIADMAMTGAFGIF